jgi:hypothetical protein
MANELRCVLCGDHLLVGDEIRSVREQHTAHRRCFERYATSELDQLWLRGCVSEQEYWTLKERERADSPARARADPKFEQGAYLIGSVSTNDARALFGSQLIMDVIRPNKPKPKSEPEAGFVTKAKRIIIVE